MNEVEAGEIPGTAFSIYPTKITHRLFSLSDKISIVDFLFLLKPGHFCLKTARIIC